MTMRQYFSVIGLLSAVLLAPQVAHATGETCTEDIMCPTGATCGGDVCDYPGGFKCVPATAAGSGMEGWCNADTDCKCKAEGATCNMTLFQCTKTVPGGTTGTGGASGTAGATGTAGASAAGSSSSAAGSSSAGSSSAGASAADSSSSGGCSLAGGVPRGSLGFVFGAACAAALIGARRRRRA